MAEVLGIASGIAGLVSLTIEIFSISYKYIHGVRDASSSLRRFLSELENLKNVLAQVKRKTKEIHQDDIFGDDGSCLLSIDSNECHDMLREVRDKLTERLSDSSLRKKLKALTWPFSEKETLNLAESLHRHLEIYSVALAADGRTLGMLTLTEVRESKISQQRVEMEAVLDWLSPLNMYQKQQDIFSRRQSSTGSWLLRDNSFQSWEKGESPHRTLWCPGDPGTGKTIMTSLVVDYLVKSYVSEDVRVAYIYCDYKDQVAQTASNLIACLIRQIIGRPKNLPQQLQELHKHLEDQKRKPSLNELKTLLVSLCDGYERIYILVDALDECEATKQRRNLLPMLESLPHGSTRLFVTSRPNNEDINQSFDKASKVTISASGSDLRQYITERIDERKDVVYRLTPQLKEKIVSSISANASGMFLLAALQIDRIFVARTVKNIKLALELMPRELDELYRQTLERIRNQAGDDGALGMRILSWITHAKRPLSVDELRHGLAVEYDEGEGEPEEFDEDNLLPQGSLVDVCAGLVIIDSTSQIIRLVHYTTQEYFKKTRSRLFEHAEVDISRACLTYLSHDFGTNLITGKLRKLAFRSHPFLDYALRHWFSHVRSVLLAENTDINFVEVVARFKSSDSLSKSIDTLKELLDPFWVYKMHFGFQFDRESKTFPLDVASALGLEELVNILLDHGTGSCPGLDRSLVFASFDGHLKVVELLLQYGARADGVVKIYDVFGSEMTTALVATCERGHLSVAKCLVENGADIHVEASGATTPLQLAAHDGNSVMIDFLLEEGVNPNARDLKGRTACHYAAAWSGSVESVKRLLDAQCDLELTDNTGQTVLHYAVDGFFPEAEMIELLLDRGADASAKNNYGETARNILRRICLASNGTERAWDRKMKSPESWEKLQQLAQRMLQMEQNSCGSAKNDP